MACKAIDCSAHPDLVKLAGREIETWASFASEEKYIANFGHDVAWSEGTNHEVVHEILRGYNTMLCAISERRILTEEQKKLAHEFQAWLSDRPTWCHITDFGLGKFSSAAFLGRQTIGSFGMMGTPGFMAPETLKDNPSFSVKSDIYSLGYLLYSLCTGRLPPSLPLPVAKILEIPPHYPKRMRDIVSRCMQSDPDKRPNGREVSNGISESYLDILEHEKFGRMRAKLSNASLETKPSQANADVKFGRDENIREAQPDAAVRGFEQLNLGISQDEHNDLLRNAVYRNDPVGVAKAIKDGANVDADAFDMRGKSNDWILRKPFSEQSLQVAKKVRQINPISGLKLVKFAAINAYWECVCILLDRKTGPKRDFEIGESILQAIDHDRPWSVELLVSRYEFDIKGNGEFSRTAVQHAVSNGKLRPLRKLLEFGANLRAMDKEEKSVFHDLSKHLYSGTGDAIVACGEWLMTVVPDLHDVYDASKQTPLHEAVSKTFYRKGQSRRTGYQVIEFLVLAGADPYKNGLTASFTETHSLLAAKS
ncbi:G2-specific serine/threonine protein kinase [Orbilia ellipsospora]|uniref:non-specific serine/threonine protein kinase n=1 Tax=Orbilia ellipsospora TaxID=2528407 RepID=A0AAV9WZD1_9PEZI